MKGTGRRKHRAYGGGSVYKQKGGRVWWLAYRVAGKLVRESTGTESETEAEKILRARVVAADSGRLAPESHSTTLADLRALVEADYALNDRKSWRAMRRGFDRLADHFGAEAKAREITVDRVEGFKVARRKEGAANACINNELAALRRGFRLAIKRGRLATRPEFSLLTPAAPRKGFFEAEAFAAVHKELAAHAKPIATFLYWSGWRSGEVIGLEWRQVDRKAGVIRIDDSKNGKPRTIPYAALPALKAVIDGQWREAEALRRKGIIVAAVFHMGGKPIETFLTGWHGACKRAGLAGRIPHDLRRTAARNMVRAGIPARVAMEVGGWKTDSVFRRYAIVDENLIAENLKKLAADAEARQ